MSVSLCLKQNARPNKVKKYLSIAIFSIIAVLCVWLMNKPSKEDIAKLMSNRLIIEELVKHSGNANINGQFTNFDFIAENKSIIVKEGKVFDPWGEPYGYGFEEGVFKVRNSKRSSGKIERIEDRIQ